jgi:hypothetical protein
MGSYDRADWHYDGENFPMDAPPERGGTHIGMFLAWCIISGLEGQFHKEESAVSLEAVQNRTMTGIEFFFKECDESFGDEDLSEEGNRFAEHYYESNLYNSDYSESLGQLADNLYDVEDTWENYDLIANIIDERFRQWRNPKIPKRVWDKYQKNALGSFGISIISVVMAFALLEGPNAKEEDYLASEGLLTKNEVLRFEEGSSDYFELWLSLQSGERFFLREPERVNLDKYSSQLTSGSTIKIRYKASGKNNVLLSITAGDQSVLSFADFIASETKKRNIFFFCWSSIYDAGSIHSGIKV